MSINDYILYINRLVSLSPDVECLDYTRLLVELFYIEFVPCNPSPGTDLGEYIYNNDALRGINGLDFRHHWCDYIGESEQYVFGEHLSCSFLEVLMALWEKASYMLSNQDAANMFWMMLSNLGLLEFSNERFICLGVDYAMENILHIVSNCMERNYNESGDNYGLFRIKIKDMRRLDLLYQMYAWMDETRDVRSRSYEVLR